MEYAVSNIATQDLDVDSLVVCLHKDASNLAGAVPEATQATIKALVEAGDFTGKKQQVLTLFSPEGLKVKRLILIGTGVDENTPLNIVAFTKLATEVQKAVANTGSQSAAWFIDNLQVEGQDKTWHVREASRTLADAQYRYTHYKSKPAPAPKVNNWQIISHADKNRAALALKEDIAVAKGMALTKDLANCPPNDCFPEILAEQALALAEEYPALKVKIITEEEAFDMGMVNAVVPHDELEDTAYQWAQEILQKSPTSIKMLKFAFNLTDDGMVGQQVFAGEATRLAYMTDEAKEGRNAFLEKRKPNFKHIKWIP